MTTKLQYKITNIADPEDNFDGYILTEDGEVAGWDESGGWSVLENQDQYFVTLTVVIN